MTEKIGKIKYCHHLLTSKQLSCQELTKKYLDAIEQHNTSLNAYVAQTAELALKTAKKVDQKISSGEPLSLLEGIPMTLKDNISTKDIPTTCCSNMLKNYVPIYDAFVWELLKNQNSVLLGKTNMDEFAMGSSCQTSAFGGAMNPHNLEYVAGGSSGGVASAVSGNLAVYGLGSDTGGSIRQPASFCGVVGLKPTYGAVSRYGLISYASSFDQIGPIASTVEDTAIVYDAIAVYDSKDSTSQRRQSSKTADRLTNSIKGMKIGIIKDYFDEISDEVKEALQNAIQVYKDLGAEIVELSLPIIKYALPIYYILACAEASSNLSRYDGIRYGYQTEQYRDIDEMICKTRSEGFGDEVKRRILLGNYVLSSGYYDAYYKKAQNLRGAVVKGFEDAFCSCDVILSATAPSTAFQKGYCAAHPIETYQSDICTVPVNIAGLPAVSVPCGFDQKGLPIGMQLIGNRFSESVILNAAYQFEQQTKNTSFLSVETGVKL